MTKTAIVSLVVFLILLSLVFFTREPSVAVGVRTLELSKGGAFLDADTLRNVRIEVPGTEGKAQVIELKKEDEEFKVMVGERAFESDQKTIDALKSAVAELEAGDFVSARSENHADFEVDEQKGKKVRLVFSGQTLDLVFGRLAKGGGNFFRKQERDEVFVSKGALPTLLNKTQNDWRRRAVVNVSKEAIDALRYERGQSVVEVQRSDDKWRLVTPQHPEFYHADSTLMKNAAFAFASLRAVGFDDGGSLGSVQGKVIAKARGKTTTLLVGEPNADKQVKVQVEGEPQIYLLNAFAGRSLLKGLADFRDLAFVSFDVEAVVKADFNSAKGVVSVEKREGAWTLLTKAPAAFDFDPNQVPARLSALTRLKAAKFLGPIGHKAAKSDVEIRLHFKDGGVKTVVLGSPVEGPDADALVVARGTKDSALYGVAAFQKSRYENALALFERPAAPAPGPPGGGMQGLGNLPPELREQILRSMQQKAP